MEIQLQELIEKIKKDGVEAAETEAAALLDAAKAQAEKIVADAKKQADKLLADAKSENERMQKSSEDAIQQAGRNLLISFRESVTRELDAILSETISGVYSSEALAQVIVNAVECWAGKPDTEDITVILNSEDLNLLEKTILSAIKARIQKGVTLKSSDSLDGGFHISVNNGNSYYDYSAETVVEMLSKYLSPKITKLLKEAE